MNKERKREEGKKERERGMVGRSSNKFWAESQLVGHSQTDLLSCSYQLPSFPPSCTLSYMSCYVWSVLIYGYSELLMRTDISTLCEHSVV